MALSVLLRNSVKPNGLSNILKLSPLSVTNTAKFTQITNSQLVKLPQVANSAQNSSSLAKRCTSFNIFTPYQPTVSSLQKFSTTPARLNAQHSHAFLWSVERILSAALIFVIPGTLLLCNPVMDNICAVAIAAHSHWGIEAIAMDYVRPIIFGNVVPKVALFLVYVMSTALLGGLLYYNYNDIGIGETFRRFWSTKKPEKQTH